FVLLAGTAVLLLLAVDRLLGDISNFTVGFTNRANAAFDGFVGVLPLSLPIIAVLISTHIKPLASHSKLVTLFALIEYVVSGLFGLICLGAGLAATLSPAAVSGRSIRAAVE